jgi:hypothetical protein
MIACSLNATDLARRREEMRAVPLLGASARLRFPRDERERVERLVQAESRCCPFLAMDVGEEGGEIVLTVGAPQGAEAVLAGMVEAFAM